MKSPAIDQLIYECMFPKPKSTDPQNFQGLLQRQLVPEVRLETQAFYGHLSSQEAKYPGLDYSYPPHQRRLERYPWHRRLFRAFRALDLTKSEIASLTKWEGTRWAKERFEREQGIVIRDTTGDGIFDFVSPELRTPAAPPAQRADMEGLEDMEDTQERGEAEEYENEMDEDGDDSDVEIQSVGVELNERLRAAVAQREAGNAATVMDEEWEQWLKDAVEAGGLPFLSSDLSQDANISITRPATESSTMHPRLLTAARLGQLQQIPDFLHTIVRRNMTANNIRLENEATTPTTPAAPSSAFSSGNVSPAPWAPRPSVFPYARAAPATSSIRGLETRTLPLLDHHAQEQLSRQSSTLVGSTNTQDRSVRLSSTRSTQHGRNT